MTVSTFYPDAETGGTTVDGVIRRGVGAALTWAEVRDAADGDAVFTGGIFDPYYGAYIQCHSAVGDFRYIFRSYYTLDTSPIGSDLISSATFSLYVTSKIKNEPGVDSYSLVSSNPASDNNLVVGDYDQIGTTLLSTAISYTSITISIYNDWVLNAAGIENINKSGISRFGMRTEWDRTNSYGGTGGSYYYSGFFVNFAEQSGTTKDPKLVVTHEAAPLYTDDNALFFGCNF